MAHADQLFSSFHRDYGAPPDAALYNAMIRGCSYHGPHERALDLFEEMLSWCLATDGFNIVGDFVGLRRLFCRMPERNVVSWNWVLSSYTRHGPHGRFSQALRFFPWMLLEGLVPNSFTVVSILSACQHLGKLRMGRWVHSILVMPALQVHAAAGTALVKMYAKCGDITSALIVFTKMGSKDVFSWNAMIRGLLVQGRAGDALRLFDLMKRQGFRPDQYTLMGVLLACSNGGLIAEGLRAFNAMQKDHSIQPSLKHYGCLIDLLCGGGNIEEALSVVWLMPCRPDSQVWRVLLGGRRVQAGLGSSKEVTTSVIQSNDGDECGV